MSDENPIGIIATSDGRIGVYGSFEHGGTVYWLAARTPAQSADDPETTSWSAPFVSFEAAIEDRKNVG